MLLSDTTRWKTLVFLRTCSSFWWSLFLFCFWVHSITFWWCRHLQMYIFLQMWFFHLKAPCLSNMVADRAIWLSYLDSATSSLCRSPVFFDRENIDADQCCSGLEKSSWERTNNFSNFRIKFNPFQWTALYDAPRTLHNTIPKRSGN